jgi:hypothetical protein
MSLACARRHNNCRAVLTAQPTVAGLQTLPAK